MLDGPETAILPEDRPMNAQTVDSVREGVLRRMERQANTIRLLIVGAAGVEALLLALALRIADLEESHSRAHLRHVGAGVHHRRAGPGGARRARLTRV